VSPGTNYNYQVALNEGLQYLKQGRLRQAEQSFKYLVDKFPGAEGGYRGLAKVHFEQEDRASALRVLRDGAAALTKSGERGQAIGLLREAITLEPRDLATHRRLAAALALAGDTDAAIGEYARFIRDLRDAGQHEKASLEAAYALGQLRDIPGSAMLKEIANGERPAAKEEPAEIREPEPPRLSEKAEPAPRALSADPWESAAKPPAYGAVDPWAPPTSIAAKPTPAAPRPAAPAVPAAKPPPASPAPATLWAESPAERAAKSAADVWSTPSAAAPVPQTPAESTAAAQADDVEVEAAAARYLATRDPRAAELALEAARRYLKDGRTDAASDLLLQLIAAGVADHDAQRLLLEVARTLGKREVARAKCQLLVQALLLDGRNDLAAEVEALARAD
jgi:thioredoxin-like negative regulator of GroEL